MKYILISAVAFALVSSLLPPHKSCEKGSDEVCQTMLNRRGIEVPSPDSCCMFFQDLQLPDTTGMDQQQIKTI